MTMNTMSVPTAAAVRAAALEVGFSPEAAEERVREGRAARAAARVWAAIRAAVGPDEDEDEAEGFGVRTARAEALRLVQAGEVVGPDGTQALRLRLLGAWADLAADAVGVGGHDGLTGDGTVRVPSLAGLGKGRKQARDGRAWTAAIAQARAALETALGETPTWEVGPEGTLTARSGSTVVSCKGPEIPPAWRMVIARRAIREWTPEGVPGWSPGTSPRDLSRALERATWAAEEVVAEDAVAEEVVATVAEDRGFAPPAGTRRCVEITRW